MNDYRDFLGEVLIPEDQLQARSAELGAEIGRDYQGKNLLLILRVISDDRESTPIVHSYNVQWSCDDAPPM